LNIKVGPGNKMNIPQEFHISKSPQGGN